MTDAPDTPRSTELVKPPTDQLAFMVTTIPEATDEDAGEKMLAAVLGAGTLEDLDNPWDSQGLEKFEDRVVRVDDIRRLPSKKADNPIGHFLVVSGRNMETGEDVTFTTGSIYVVAQLVKAYMMGGLPSDWRVVSKETSTPGRRAHHLEYLGRPFGAEGS